jgi:hypothetical protein
MPDPLPIGYRDFTDGARRPVYADPDGRQYVLGNDGEQVEDVVAARGRNGRAGPP